MIPEAYQDPPAVLAIWEQLECAAAQRPAESRAVALSVAKSLIRWSRKAWARAVRG